MKNTGRIEYVDLVRGFGIVFMIMGHIGFGELYARYCNSFHMPLFFFVSGYFYKDEDIVRFLKKKVGGLVIPYAAWCILGNAGAIFVPENYGMPHLMFSLVFPQKGIPFVGAIWFLISLFWGEFFYWVVQKIFSKLGELQKDAVVLFCCIVTSFCGYYIGRYFDNYAPFNLSASLTGMFFIHAGRMHRSLKIDESVSESVSERFFKAGILRGGTCSY